jgi:radical SAM superfamily enzyme YgiQ (UPF0313 family)
MRHNVYLFQPQFAVDVRDETNYWLPYSVGCIWSYAQQFDWVNENFTLKDLIFKRQDPKELLDSLDNPSICGFSIYVWNQKYCMILAKEIKQRWPDCVIVIGGPQASTSMTKLDYVDSVVLAEGEESFLKLLKAIKDNKPVPELFLKSRLQDLDIPSPYTTGVFDTIIKNNPDAIWSMVLETNRGCPYACTFCDWGGTTYSKVKRFSLEHVQFELDWAAANPVAFIFCADANFGMFKERDLEIARMIKRCADIGMVESVNLQYAKNSTEVIFEIARELGHLHRGITVSVQSMNDKTLEIIERKNMDVNDISKMLELGQKYQIGTYTEAILGLPEETLETWRDGMCKILEMGQHDAIDIYFCQLLENSALATFESRMQYKIKTVVAYDYLSFSNPDDYQDIKEDILLINQTSTMTTDDIIEAYMYSWIIINFHIAGYTQLYAKFCRNVLDISYRQFYDTLVTIIKQDDVIGQHYKEYKQLLTIYLTTGVFDMSVITDTSKAHGHGLVSKSAKLMYDNKELVMKLGAECFSKFSDELDVINPLQQHFVYDHTAVMPIIIEVPLNLTDWTRTNTKYSIETKNKMNKHFDFFYARRRGGLKNIFKYV